MTLRRRQVLVITAVVALVVAVAAVAAYLVTATTLRQDTDERLRTVVENLQRIPVDVVRVREGGWPLTEEERTALLDAVDEDLRAVLEEALTFPERGGGFRPADVTVAGQPGQPGQPGLTVLLDPAGEPMGVPMDGPPLADTPAVQAVLDGADGVVLETVALDGEDFRVAAVRLDNGAIAQVAQSVEGNEQALRRLVVVLLGVTAGGTVLGAGAGLALSRTALRPVVDLTASAEAMTPGTDPSARLPVTGTDEVARLAGSFNGVLDALADVVARQQRLVADASHELRTPLASVRTNVELLQQGRTAAADREALLGETVAQLDELTRLVANLVDLARGEELGGDPVPIDLTAVVTDAVARARRGHPSVSFAVEGDAGEVVGVADRLSRAVGNLLDNAGKFSPAGATVSVRMTPGRVTVADAGPGVASEDRDRVFDRFWRARSAHEVPGSGLGLAIVAEVARAHAGTVAVEGDGPGATFVLSLPPLDDCPGVRSPGRSAPGRAGGAGVDGPAVPRSVG